MTIIVSNGEDQVSRIPMTELERSIFVQKQNSSVVYRYETPADLAFELNMRSRIVSNAIALNNSGLNFSTFEKSKCNERVWTRNDNGGFSLNYGVQPSHGILDIFQNGHLYATECATAMVIVMYRSMLDGIGKAAFDYHFKDIVLYDWEYDSDLRLIPSYNNSEAYPGDIVYFENPDYNPETPEWQGENAIVLGNNLYYGHGIGIKTADEIIASLNKERVPGSTTPAYFSDFVLSLDFEYTRSLAAGGVSPFLFRDKYSNAHIYARIGTHLYMQ
ncbi:protein-glutamine gamma-glutamyltransferase [Paenibacillus marinisediminis]